MTQRRNFFKDDFAAARRQPARQRAAEEQSDHAAGADEPEQPGERDLKPAVRRAEIQMDQEENNGEKSEVDVDLQPRFGPAQRQERKFLARIEKSQHEHGGEQNPAGEISVVRQFVLKTPV